MTDRLTGRWTQLFPLHGTYDVIEAAFAMALEDDLLHNKAEFSNGLDLRNRYIHDTNSLDEQQQQNDYIVLLKMFIILVIKINEEFCLQDKISKNGADFYKI